MSSPSLPKNLTKAIFTSYEAQQSGISRYTLRKLLEAGDLQKIGRNLYAAPDCPLDDESLFRSATARLGKPALLCLISALTHYGLTDTISKQTWVMVPETKRSRWSDLRLLRSRRPNWKVGVNNEDGYQMTDIDRTLVDALVYKRLIGSNVALSALRKAIKDKKSSLSSVLTMAKKLGVERIILPYIETLS